MIIEYIIDFTLVAILIVGTTALMGVIVNGIGEKVFGGKEHSLNFTQSAKTQVGWKSVGGLEQKR